MCHLSSLLPAVLQKISIEQTTGIVVLPNWPTQPYYATAMNMLISKPLLLKRNKQLLQLPLHPEMIHQIWKKLDLLVCHLSGNPSRVKTFHNKLLISLCPPGGQRHQSSTSVISNSGRGSAVSGLWIPFDLMCEQS